MKINAELREMVRELKGLGFYPEDRRDFLQDYNVKGLKDAGFSTRDIADILGYTDTIANLSAFDPVTVLTPRDSEFDPATYKDQRQFVEGSNLLRPDSFPVFTHHRDGSRSLEIIYVGDGSVIDIGPYLGLNTNDVVQVGTANKNRVGAGKKVLLAAAALTAALMPVVANNAHAQTNPDGSQAGLGNSPVNPDGSQVLGSSQVVGETDLYKRVDELEQIIEHNKGIVRDLQRVLDGPERDTEYAEFIARFTKSESYGFKDTDWGYRIGKDNNWWRVVESIVKVGHPFLTVEKNQAGIDKDGKLSKIFGKGQDKVNEYAKPYIQILARNGIVRNGRHIDVTVETGKGRYLNPILKDKDGKVIELQEGDIIPALPQHLTFVAGRRYEQDMPVIQSGRAASEEGRNIIVTPDGNTVYVDQIRRELEKTIRDEYKSISTQLKELEALATEQGERILKYEQRVKQIPRQIALPEKLVDLVLTGSDKLDDSGMGLFLNHNQALASLMLDCSGRSEGSLFVPVELAKYLQLDASLAGEGRVFKDFAAKEINGRGGIGLKATLWGIEAYLAATGMIEKSYSERAGTSVKPGELDRFLVVAAGYKLKYHDNELYFSAAAGNAHPRTDGKGKILLGPRFVGALAYQVSPENLNQLMVARAAGSKIADLSFLLDNDQDLRIFLGASNYHPGAGGQGPVGDGMAMSKASIWEAFAGIQKGPVSATVSYTYGRSEQTLTRTIDLGGGRTVQHTFDKNQEISSFDVDLLYRAMNNAAIGAGVKKFGDNYTFTARVVLSR